MRHIKLLVALLPRILYLMKRMQEEGSVGVLCDLTVTGDISGMSQNKWRLVSEQRNNVAVMEKRNWCCGCN